MATTVKTVVSVFICNIRWILIVIDLTYFATSVTMLRLMWNSLF
uniref:Uncharacterized protein n=2 Tax=Anguilla anguilla TaxID=7936 RepID=A0A0E9PLP1_ANGAN